MIASSRYVGVSTAMLLSLLDVAPLSRPAIAAELQSRGVDRRATDRRIVASYGRRSTDTAVQARIVGACSCGVNH